MKNLIILAILLIFVSCGKNMVETRYVNNDMVKEVPVVQDFEGVYYFEYGGYLEIIVGEDNELTIMREGQSLQSVNPYNDTIGSHPTIYKTGLEVVNGVASWYQNVTYNSDTYDIEEDEAGKDIDGSRRTDFELKMVDGNLQLTIRIYDGAINNNVNYIIAERVFISI